MFRKFGLAKRIRAIKGNRRLELLVLVVIVLAVEIVSLISANTTKLTAFWSAIQPRDQHYTALAFSNPNGLPTYLPSNGVLKFAFTVSNDEATPVTYRYDLSIATGSTVQYLPEQSVTLQPQAQATIPESLTLARTTSPETITVMLPNQQESIDFILQGSTS